jgi:hypothetical protein
VNDEQAKAFEDRVNNDPRFKGIEERMRHALIDGDQAAFDKAEEDMRLLLAELRGH